MLPINACELGKICLYPGTCGSEENVADVVGFASFRHRIKECRGPMPERKQRRPHVLHFWIHHPFANLATGKGRYRRLAGVDAWYNSALNLVAKSIFRLTGAGLSADYFRADRMAHPCWCRCSERFEGGFRLDGL